MDTIWINIKRFVFTVISIHNFPFVQFALVKTVMNMQHEL